MREDFEKIEYQYHTLESFLACGDAMADMKKYTESVRKFSMLESLVFAISNYRKLEKQKTEVEVLLKESSDEQILKVAAEELEEITLRMQRIEEGIEEKLYEEDTEPSRGVIVEIRQAAGGKESGLFAAELLRMYTKYAESKGWKVEVLTTHDIELGGIKEVVFAVKGDGAYAHFKFESGVHRVQRVPETEAGGRIHTSTVTVAVLKEPEEIELNIDPKDLKIDTFRAGGAGGQHVNKTDSAVRITHLPTGFVVVCQDERSQGRNKEKAMRVLRAKIMEEQAQRQENMISSERRIQVGGGERSEKIRTYNFPQRRVTDHRGSITIYRLEEFLNGDLDLVIKPLIIATRKKKI